MCFEIFGFEDRQREREMLTSYDLDLKFFELLGLKIKQIVPERNCFRIESDKGFYCLKKMDFTEHEMELMQDVTAHLRKNGFVHTFEIASLANGEILQSYGGNQYYLTKWMDGRESSYLNMLDIKAAAEALARFHIAALGFQVGYSLPHRRLFGKWKQGFMQELKEIQTAREHLIAEGKINKNAGMAIKYLESCEESARHALKLIDKSSYDKLNERDELKKGFIHHDYGLHNILHTFDNQTFIGGLESCAFDIRMHDLGHFIFRLMRRRGWNMDEVLTIIGYYDEIYRLEKEDYEALTVYFNFPHDFKQFCIAGKEVEELGELDRINTESEYSQGRKNFLYEFEIYSKLL